MDMTVVVTGAGAGVGRAAARAFAERGYDVGLLARDADRLDMAAHEIRAHGRRACPVPADVSDPEAAEAAAERIERELGPIDVWVNNAMATIFAPVHNDLRPSTRSLTHGVPPRYRGDVSGHGLRHDGGAEAHAAAHAALSCRSDRS